MPVLARGIVPVLIIAFQVYCVLDVIATDTGLVRNLPKLPWIFIVLLFPPIGGVAWLLLGRPEGAGFAVGGSTPRRQPSLPEYGPGTSAKDLDRPLSESREEAIRRYEEERRRRQEEIERLERALEADDEEPDDGPDPAS